MLPGQGKNTNIYVGLRLIGQILGKSMLEGSSPGLGALITLGACALFIWGCCEYAFGKGHSRWWGGPDPLSIFGVIVLVFLPNRHKDAVFRVIRMPPARPAGATLEPRARGR